MVSRGLLMNTIQTHEIISSGHLTHLPAGPSVQRLHSFRCCAFSLSFPYPSSIIQSMSFCLGLPLPLFLPSFLPLSPSVESCLLEYVPSSSSALFNYIYIKDLFTFPLFPILLH